MTLPKEIYVWNEEPEEPEPSLNIERDGKRPQPDPDSNEPLRAGVYRLVREVDIINDVKEVEVKPATDPFTGFVRHLK